MRLREALTRIPSHSYLYLEIDVSIRRQLEEEFVAARVRSLHRSQVLSDFASELSAARTDNERHAARAKYARPLEAWGEVHRRITSFGIVLSDGSTATDVNGSASALAEHWAPIFNHSDDISDVSAHHFLSNCCASPQVAALRPLDFDAFCHAIGHTRASSPGPDGLPYSVWDAAGDAGKRILDQAYQDLLRGFPPPPDFNRSLVVYIPKELDHASPARVRPITLSNTSHKLLAKAIKATLEKVAEITVHPAQRGFMPGRGMLDNVFEALAPMHVARLLEASAPAIVLFDIRSAFPSVAWQWIWKVTRAVSAPAWLITAVQLLYEGSYSDVVFAGEVSEHGFPIRRGILQGCLASGSLWAILFDPIVRALMAAHPEPRGSLTAFADDLAAAFINVVAGLGPLSWAFLHACRWPQVCTCTFPRWRS